MCHLLFRGIGFLLSKCLIYCFTFPCCMMTSSNGNISALIALCEGNPPVSVGFPSQRPVTRGFDVFFDLGLNKQLSKHLRIQWFETPLRSLQRHCNVLSEQSLLKWVLVTPTQHNTSGAWFSLSIFKSSKSQQHLVRHLSKKSRIVSWKREYAFYLSADSAFTLLYR